MKKYLSILIFTTFIFPSVALASWWNPFSWFNNWSFSEKLEPKTEILEKRILELESKLNSSTTPAVSSIKETKKEFKENPASINNSNVNLIVPVSDMTAETALKNKALDIFNQEIIAIESFNKSVVEDIDYMNKVKSNFSGYTNDSSVALIDYTNDRLFENKKTVASNQEMLEYLRSEKNLLQSQPLTYFSTYQIDKDNYEVLETVQNAVASHNEEYNTYKKYVQNEQKYIDGLTKKTEEKSNGLNAINLKIAELNAKYADDMKKCNSNNSGGLVSGVTACKNSKTETYTNDYNALMAEWQLIKYGN